MPCARALHAGPAAYRADVVGWIFERVPRGDGQELELTLRHQLRQGGGEEPVRLACSLLDSDGRVGTPCQDALACTGGQYVCEAPCGGLGSLPAFAAGSSEDATAPCASQQMLSTPAPSALDGSPSLSPSP